MSVAARCAGLLGALLLLLALDVVIARVDVFTPLVPDTRPTGLFTSINRQLTDVARALYGLPPGPPPVVILGNSQMEALVRPLGALDLALAAAGAPAGTRAVSLCVFATAPTDAEVLTRRLGRLHPGIVLLGIAAPDVGTPLARARDMPVLQTFDIGFRDGLVAPAGVEERLDRWVRTVWHLYRYRRLFHDLVLPPAELRTPGAFLEAIHTPAEIFAGTYGAARAAELLALRATWERTDHLEDFVRYVELLRGADYLPGLRDRWHDLAPEPLQVEALRRTAAHVRAAGARLVWLLVPENPLWERDPVVGAEVAARSDAVASQFLAEANALDVPLLDLRHAVPPAGFLDFNHVVYQSGALLDAIAGGLARQGVLGG